MQIGPHTLENNLILAPMAGISDRPFRAICKQFGAGLTVSEMVSSLPSLQTNRRTLLKADHSGEKGLRSVQIVGTNPRQMAEAAKLNTDRGADIIDINMGCPAKKVCAVAAGSALMRDEDLVKRILEAVVEAVSVPVTLKIRTGWDLQNRNAPTIAQIAERAGIAALTVHGRTRACKFNGNAEYETIKQIKKSVAIPVIANGDIDSADKARYVLKKTSADALMIGRGAQGNPWIFSDINRSLRNGEPLEPQTIDSIRETLLNHVQQLYSFYGNLSGVKIARKHIGWYFDRLGILPVDIRNAINRAQQPIEQIQHIDSAFRHFSHHRAA